MSPSKATAADTKPHTGAHREATDTPTEDDHMGEETKRPTNPRTNILPKDGFVLTIDGKMKARYESDTEATAEASKLKQRFPVIQVAVYGAAERVYTLVNTAGE